MNPQLVITADGSPTLYIEEWQEHYHSMHGAVQESKHVFLDAGLIPLLEKLQQVRILEVGLGTGFNALLTLATILQTEKRVTYHALEPHPIPIDIIEQFTEKHLLLLGSGASYFHALHRSPWQRSVDLHPQFTLTKLQMGVQAYTEKECLDLVYFDAFSPRVQPDMWVADVFLGLYHALATNGVLVTYCAKGAVRRTLQEVGFQVERLPGPPGKREMLRATKF